MFYARLMPVRGAGVDRCTRMCKDKRAMERAMERAIRQQCYAIRDPGPYLVTRYEQGTMIGSTLED